ncbi:SIR2-domain-containing protein [Obba rivulosa]|uniref:SIR2-domain-containing protein n=1 Tax=Obba rivulosa TaxID=1052685 RepID=A0A8E2J6Z8_9APHY|nr:SIR2-domain-containing protein [Obba rivulosa]
MLKQHILRTAQIAWKEQEVKDMLYYLKEHGISAFIGEYVISRDIPIPKLLYAFGVCLCKELRMKRRKTLLYFLRVALQRELEAREKLPQYNTVDDVVKLIRERKRIIILTGAGISVSCGIPDFRSRDGIYATLARDDHYNLDDPQQMFDIHYFREDPALFYSFASKIYPSNFIPSPCHRFIKLIEDKGKLLRNYTQNIDTLETRAGVHRVLQCHGSFATATCLNCKAHVPGSDIEPEIMEQTVPLCKICNSAAKEVQKNGKKKKASAKWNSDQSDESDAPAYPPGIMKPDITFFGEKLNDVFDRALLEDRQQVDLLLVIGTSLKVAPVSDILAHLPHSVPQILINKTPVRHINPDIVLLGNADEIVQHLCQRLHWDLPELPANTSSTNPKAGRPRRDLKRPSQVHLSEPRRVGNTHVWLFEGAEGGKWVQDLERESELDSDGDSDTTPAPISGASTYPVSKKARTS